MIHAADLRHGLVALVDDHERVRRQVIEQRRRRLAGAALREVPRVVLDAVAVADLLDHLEIEHRPLMQPLRFEDLAVALELAAAHFELLLDGDDGFLQPLAAGHEVRLRIHRRAIVALERLAGDRIERGQLVDLVAEQPDAQRQLFVRRIDLDDVAAHPEGAARELVIVALVLDFDELAQDLIAIDALPFLERQHQAVIRLRRTQAVNARHAGDDDDVAALEERPGGRQPHAIDLVVDRRFLLDVGVAGRHVRFGLVVVVVADEILDGVLGKEPPEFLEQLRGEGLVVRHHQRRPVHARNHLRHAVGLARAGDAEQHLVLVAAVQPLDQLGHGLDLVAGELEIRCEGEAVGDGRHECVCRSTPSYYGPRFAPSATAGTACYEAGL